MKSVISILVCTFLLFSAMPALSVGIYEETSAWISNPRSIDGNYIVSKPFRIDSDLDFASSSKVSAGDGSVNKPWVIENLDINGTGEEYCIFISNTQDHFVVRNCSLHGVSRSHGAALNLEEVENGMVYNNTISSNYFYGIYLSNSNNNIIAKNTARDNYVGMCISHSDSNDISNNIVGRNENVGIILHYSDSNTVSHNNVYLSGSYGISLITDCDRNVISVNTVSDNWAGIHIFQSSTNTLTGNTMVNNGVFISGGLLEHWNTHTIDTSNTVDGKPVRYWKDRTSGTVPSGAGQVILANCENVLVEKQSLCNGSIGILAGQSTRITIANNTARFNDYFGIMLNHCDSCTVEYNIVSQSGERGIYVFYSDQNILSHNRISEGRTSTGIFIMESSSNAIYENTCSGNGWGTWLSVSTWNTLLNNTIMDNQYSIGTYLSENNTIANNTILNNEDSIRLESSSSNMVFHNMIIGNTNRSIDDTGTNQWDNGYPSGGNYWSDYEGTDSMNGPDQDRTGPDGIGDSAYTNIDGGKESKDRFPLITPEDILDGIAPTSQVNAEAPYWSNVDPHTITATASDRSGVDNVEMYYRFSADNSTWGGWTLIGTDTEQPWSWDLSWPSGDGHYQFHTVALDNAGNREEPPQEAEAYHGYDGTSPQIIRTDPDDGATGIIYRPGIFSARFSEPMNRSITDFTSNLPEAKGRWNGNGTWFNITYSDLKEGFSYYVDFTGQGHRDLIGNPLIGEMNISFTTRDFTPIFIDAGGDISIENGDEAFFKGAISSDNGIIRSHNWTFTYNGVQTLLWGMNTTFRFNIPGHYVITLCGEDEFGISGADTLNLTVIDTIPPVPKITGSIKLFEDEVLEINAFESSDNGRIVRYIWNFVDSEPVQIEGPTLTYFFELMIPHEVFLTVCDEWNNSDTTSVLVEFEDVTSPIANAGQDQTVGAGSIIVLNGTSSTDNGLISRYSWSFTYKGEKMVIEGDVVSFQFDDGGLYNIILTVFDLSYNYGDDTINITVVDTGNIRGTVIDNDGRHIEGARVEIIANNGKTYTGITNSDGTFSVEVFSGNITWKITKQGYKSISGISYVSPFEDFVLNLSDTPLIKEKSSSPPIVPVLIPIILLLLIIIGIFIFIFLRRKNEIGNEEKYNEETDEEAEFKSTEFPNELDERVSIYKEEPENMIDSTILSENIPIEENNEPTHSNMEVSEPLSDNYIGLPFEHPVEDEINPPVEDIPPEPPVQLDISHAKDELNPNSDLMARARS